MAGAVPPVSPAAALPGLRRCGGESAGWGCVGGSCGGACGSGVRRVRTLRARLLSAGMPWRGRLGGRDDVAAAGYGWSCRARYGGWCGGDDSGDGTCYRLVVALLVRVVR